jgi:hypothetical protein
MQRPSAVIGTVVDHHGEPMEGLTVELSRPVPRNGRNVLTRPETVTPRRTDDRGERDAKTAAALSRRVKRPRQQQADLAIAACAIEHGAALWTLNAGDFDDIPDLTVYQTPSRRRPRLGRVPDKPS